jgi:parallel beta-helix repeat protein
MLRLLLLTTFFALLALRTEAATYYVDGTRGNDTRDGKSLKTAWKTLAKANFTLRPGDTCLVRGGKYPNDAIAPARSGIERSPITYAAYQKEKPELGGGDSGSVVLLADRSHIIVRGFIIRPIKAHDWVVQMSGEKSQYNRLEKCDISDPQGYAPVVIFGGSHNTVTACVIHDTGHGEEGSGDCVVLNGGAHHNTISRNKLFNGCHSQCLIMNGAHHNTLVENDLYSTKRDWAGAGFNLVLGADSNTIARNRIHDLGYITDGKCAIQIDTADNVIRDNVIENCGAFGISPQSYAYGGKRQVAEGNLIEGNTVRNCGRQGLMFVSKSDCLSRNNRIVKNTITSTTADWYGLKAWIMVFDTYHLAKPASPGDWLGNTFEGNTFLHAKPGAPNMVLYNHRGNAVTWSIPELEKRYPKTWQGNREGRGPVGRGQTG